MYKHILIATDGSELAGRALAHGLALAKELNAPVTVVTVTQPWSAPEMALFSAGKANLDPVRQFEDMAAASAKVILDDAGHWPWIERPDAVETVAGFLRRDPRRGSN